MAGFTLSAVELTIVIFYLVIAVGIGLAVAGKTWSGNDLFLAGRRLDWPSLGISLSTARLSSTALLLTTAAAYERGLAAANEAWVTTLVLVVFAWLGVPFYVRSRISTVPELLEKRFDRRTRLYVSALTIAEMVVVEAACALHAGAIIVELFLPGLDGYLACGFLVLVAALYTAAGGLAAVVYNDVIKGALLFVAVAAVTGAAFARLGFEWSAVASRIPAEALSHFHPAADPAAPWPGTLAGLPILAFYLWCTSQLTAQRVLAARDADHARWGTLLAGALQLVLLVLLVLSGLFARRLYPDLDSPHLAFATLTVELLPVGVIGIVLAAIVAVILSTTAAALTAASTLLTRDFIEPPDLNPLQAAKLGRIAILAFAALAALLAPLIGAVSEGITGAGTGALDGILTYVQTVLAYATPPVAAIFALGFVWKRAARSAAFATLVLGHLLAFGMLALHLTGHWTLHPTHTAALLFAASCVVFAVAGARRTAPAPAADS